MVAAYSPAGGARRAGVLPSPWAALNDVAPTDSAVYTAPQLLRGKDPWAETMPGPQTLDLGLVAEGHTIPVARVPAMHEGKRRRGAPRVRR